MSKQQAKLCWQCLCPAHTSCLRCGRDLCNLHAYPDPTPNRLSPLERLTGHLCNPCFDKACLQLSPGPDPVSTN
jgi:hypothetical protein